MSLLVHYTLKSAEDHHAQIAAMEALVTGLKSEGAAGVNYTCFSTDEPTAFIGLLEFSDDAGKNAFLNSRAFAAYRETVGPTFANPPETTGIMAIASTRA